MRTPFIYTAVSLHVGRLRRMYFFLALALVVLLVAFWTVFGASTKNFPIAEVVAIPEGASAREVATILQEQQVIDSPKVFLGVAHFFFNPEDLQAGDYIFEKKLSTFSVARRIIEGEYGLTPLRITFFEGMNTREMAELLDERLPHTNPAKFRAAASEYEGYLFPDTYYFLPNVTEQEVVDAMRDEFERQITSIDETIKESGRSLDELVTMASLIEEETRTPETRRMVSGILWNRIEIGMPLQVDAVFGYIYDTQIFSPRFSDLEIDSPYNTYQNAGLPPGPITNPGLDSIIAAAEPTESEYLFYLTGTDGTFRYATDFDQHRVNRTLYLD